MNNRAWAGLVGCVVGGIVCTVLHDKLGNQLWGMLAVAIIGLSEGKR